MAIELINIMLLLLPLFIILLGCELFTNGIEWLGLKLGLAESATGSILAAVGTALPETMVPIVAILFVGHGAGHEIAEGAILGAPFMLATLAMLVGGLSVFAAYRRGRRPANLVVSREHVSLDIRSFLLAYSFAIAAALFLQGEGEWAHILRYILAGALIILYILYVRKMITDESKKCDTPGCLYFVRPFSGPKRGTPSLSIVVIQVLASLGMIILGARIFVIGIESISVELGVSNIILAFLIAPVATELPEKFNSVLWYWRGKDTLALGNITGAMVFQSSIPVSIGIIFTDWIIDPIAIFSMMIAMIAMVVVYFEVQVLKRLSYKTLILSGAFYFFYIFLLICYPSLGAS